MTHVGIVGSRNFARPEFVYRFVKLLKPTTVVISGGARGVDQWAATAAREFGLHVIEFMADWDRHGKRAGFLRNAQIIESSDYVAGFWDGESRGTKHSLTLAYHAQKLFRVYLADGTRMTPEQFGERYVA